MSSDPSSPNTTSRRRPLTAFVLAAFALALFAAAVWFWVQGRAASYVAWESGALIGGGVICFAAIIAAFRAGFDNLLEWIWGLVDAVLAVITGIFRGLLSLLGWD
jgi:hypothetical protein